MASFPKLNVAREVLKYRLIKTTKRIIFDIIWQDPEITFSGVDDDDYYIFHASNHYAIISRSRMDVQTERLWLKGGTNDSIAFRSGTMIFDGNEKRDKAYNDFLKALKEWEDAHNYIAIKVTGDD